MNSVKSVGLTFFRGYSRRLAYRVKNSKIPSKPDNSHEEYELYPGVTENNYNPMEEYDNFEDDESDFSSAGQSYTEHLGEEKYKKELLKMRIVTRKYFKSTDPNFITWSEKNQIRLLHKENSSEWSPERLSEAFPALPETIRKILKSNVLANSVESVIKYDQKVIENWKKFKAGSLAVNPKLENHLKKFKDRKLEITNLTTTAKQFVKQPPVFPKPKSRTFSSIVGDYIGDTAVDKNKNNNQLQITDQKDANNSLVKTSQKVAFNNNERVTFDAFVENTVEKIAGNTKLSPTKIILIDEYKQQRNRAALIDESNIPNNTVPQIEVKESPKPIQTVEPTITAIKIPKLNIDQSSMDTGILKWEKKASSDEENYPNYIKIPRSKSKSGVTFKVQDRYYDTDGEFLYRVPGLKM